MLVQVGTMHCTIWPIAPRPCFVAAAGPVRIIPGFLDDVLEDLPPASEQAAVMLVQIGFEICQILLFGQPL